MSIIATIAAAAVPLVSWGVSSRLQREVPLAPGGIPKPAGGGSTAPPPTDTRQCMSADYFSADLVPPISAISQLGPAAAEILDGVSGYYFTPAGQEALLGLLMQKIMLTPNRPYRGNRSVIVREALTQLFPECDWNKPMSQYTAEQYTAWLSAWPLSAATEAAQGLDLDVGPPQGQTFIPRAAVGLSPSAGTLSAFPPGTFVRLLSATADGDDGTWVDVTVSGVGAVAQEVIVESAGPLGNALGLTAGSKHIVDVPSHAMTILQSTQPNPRQPNPQRSPVIIGQPPRQPMFSPRMGR